LTDSPRERLARRLNLADAVVIGLGAMIGAGIFAAPAPAADAAGSLLLAGLGIAAVVAYANATSSARLAAVYPESGGTYVYARERLGPYWGFLAGWAFTLGKTASLAAMALTFGAYAYPPLARPLGIGAVVVLAAVNYRGVHKTARLTRILLTVVVAALAVVVAAALGGGTASVENLSASGSPGPLGVLRSAGLLFFAFAGYARIATLGEEVVNPEVTIPRAVPIALAVAVVVYAIVLGAALLAAGPETLARSSAPLANAVEAGRWNEVAPVVRIGAAVASAGVLLSLLAGVSRTTFSMARRGDIPGFLAAVHPTYRTPHHAELFVAAIVVVVVAVADVRGTIGFSSFAVLGYYALTNASAWTLGSTERATRPVAAIGLVGCLVLALTLPSGAVIGGAALLIVGSVAWFMRRRT